jgi:hypothetical protein
MYTPHRTSVEGDGLGTHKSMPAAVFWVSNACHVVVWPVAAQVCWLLQGLRAGARVLGVFRFPIAGQGGSMLAAHMYKMGNG